MKPENAPSTPVDELQLQRLRREVRRAKERAEAMQRNLRDKGREGSTGYGAALFELYGESVGVAIDALLTDLLENPTRAGKHFSAWPLLLHFCDRGPRSIAAIALGVVIDGISTTPQRPILAKRIGRALQDELKAIRLRRGRGAVLAEMVKKEYGKRAVSTRVLGQLHVDPSGWTVQDRRELGQLLLEVIAANTNLITFSDERIPRVLPTEDVLEVVRLNPPRPLPVRMLPSIVPPEPWCDVRRDGKALVSSRRPMDLSHITAKSCATQLEVVNYVEQQQLQIDPWMVAVQREAWDCNLPGLFSVQRDPQERWLATQQAPERARIEESLRQFTEVQGYPIWLEHDFDFRGRLYCSSRIAGHQGPDHQKALISFAQKEAVDDDAFNQMLSAAAGHYGLGHCTWDERVEWGRDHLSRLQAISAQPLDRLDLWKSAKDPWQFLQIARAISDVVAGDLYSGVPIRFDQTASGMGIIGALCRDRQLALHTNIIGDRRSDLYAYISGCLLNLLQADLDSFDPRDQRLAEMWLQYPIGRDLAKGPTMTTIYGARHFGIVEQLIDWLRQKKPDVPVERWAREYTLPAQYLAHKLNIAIGAELKSCVELEKWLRKVSALCVKKQKRIEWTSPLGFPIALGNELERQQKVRTDLHGARRWQQADAGWEPGELSARATNRGITANTIHTFDAAHCQAVVLRCAQIETPVLTNHDCFATIPARADWLHHALLHELSALYRQDWLAEMRVEIGKRAGVHLPHPPMVGDLCEGEIGQNPYCFS